MSIPFAAISAAALANALSLLADWFPQGRTCGREFKVGNLRGDPGCSLSINLDTGVWADFAEGISGADFIDLRAAMAHGGNKGAAAKELARRVGIFINGAARSGRPRIVDRYDYPDQNGALLFQVVRFDPKDFRQRRPDGKGGWIWKMDGVQRVPYRLPKVIAAIANKQPIFIAEGEKGVAAIERLGFTGTCSPGGAGKWRQEYSPWFRDADVILLPDNDNPGRDHVAQVGSYLRDTAARLRILALPGLADKADIADWVANGGTAAAFAELAANAPSIATAPEPTPETIDGDWWIARELTRPVPVLGEVICASTRALIGGPTGAGKTHLAMAMAGAIITSRKFLHWAGPAKPLVVLYIDGEMARDLIQDRMGDLQRRLGGVSLANLHMLCREDFPAMQGLNTPPGQAFVLAAVERLKPSVIFLDSRMSLLVGDMKDEVPWTETMPLVWELTRLQVAQIWLDHTGHDGGHIYGSKTKEWQMDLVGLVEEANDPSADIAMKLRWTKARRRRPETRADFSPGIITLRGDEWLWTPDEAGDADRGAKRGRGMSDETELLRRAINTLAYDPSVQMISVPETSFPVRAVGVVTTISYLITNGWFVERSDFGEEIVGEMNTLTRRGRDRLRNSLTTLKRNGICGFNRDFVWPAKPR